MVRSCAGTVGLLAAIALQAESVGAQVPQEPAIVRVSVTCDGSRNMPVESAARLQQHFEAQLVALEALVGWPLPEATPPLRVELFGDRPEAEVAARALLGRVLDFPEVPTGMRAGRGRD